MRKANLYFEFNGELYEGTLIEEFEYEPETRDCAKSFKITSWELSLYCDGQQVIPTSELEQAAFEAAEYKFELI